MYLCRSPWTAFPESRLTREGMTTDTMHGGWERAFVRVMKVSLSGCERICIRGRMFRKQPKSG